MYLVYYSTTDGKKDWKYCADLETAKGYIDKHKNELNIEVWGITVDEYSYKELMATNGAIKTSIENAKEDIDNVIHLANNAMFREVMEGYGY